MKIFLVCKESKNSSEQCPSPIWNFLSRDSKFQILQTTQKRIQNFWSPKNTTKDFEFLILKEHNEGFRISDPQIPQERIQYFWYPKDSEFLIPYNDTQKDSEFLIPYKDTKVFRISDPPKNTGEDSEFLIYRGTLAGKGFRISHLPSSRIPNIFSQKNIVSSEIGIPDHPNNSSQKKKYFSLWAQSSHKICGKNHYWRILE